MLLVIQAARQLVMLLAKPGARQWVMSLAKQGAKQLVMSLTAAHRLLQLLMRWSGLSSSAACSDVGNALRAVKESQFDAVGAPLPVAAVGDTVVNGHSC